MNVRIAGFALLLSLNAITFPGEAQIRTASGKEISTTAMDDFLRIQMDSLNLPGITIAIIKDKKIVYEKQMGYANLETKKKVDKETIFEAASMSKTVFSWFVLKLMQDGILKMSLDTPLYKYRPYPDIAYDDRYKLITGRMVLTHTTGFPNWRTGDSLKILFTPGTKYSYSGEAYEYLCNVVATLTHTSSPSLDSILGEQVAKPLGLQHFAFTTSDYMNAHKAYGYYSGQNESNGKFKPASKWFGASYSLHTNAHDYAKFLIGIMNNKGLSAANTDTLLAPRVTMTDDDKPLVNAYGNEKQYGFGIVTDKTPYGKRYLHYGNNGNYTGGYMFFKDQGVGVVVFTNGDKGVFLAVKLADLLTDGIIHYPIQ